MASASAFKEQGNEALKAGRTAQAVELYSQAIELEPRNHLLYSNRAAALAVLDRYEDALNDAAQVVVLEPKWVKGHARKGAALKSLKRYPEAIAAYQHAQRLEPSNLQVKKALVEVESLQRDGGRNWADDLASSDEDEPAKPPPRAQVGACGKRPRIDDVPERGAAASQQPRRGAGPPPRKQELAQAQEALAAANVHTLRACLLQMAKTDAEVCGRIIETVEELAERSSDGDDADGNQSSADDDDV
jgi:tetratricopeptide (TPR) repeat protein